MASINLLLQSKISPAVIYIRLRDGRNIDVKAKTNYNIDPVNWDKATQRPLKKLLKDICAEYQLDTASVLEILKTEQINATADMTIKAIAEKNQMSPIDVYTIIRNGVTN